MEFTIAGLVEATAALVPSRPAGDHGTLSYAELVDRSRRLARFLGDHGLGAHREPNLLRGHETGQDFLAQYLYNSPAYLEGLVSAFRGRLAPVNVNYRYGVDELRYLLLDSRPAAIQYHAAHVELGDYLERLVETKRRKPGDDLVSRLGEHVNAGTFSVRAPRTWAHSCCSPGTRPRRT